MVHKSGSHWETKNIHKNLDNLEMYGSFFKSALLSKPKFISVLFEVETYSEFILDWHLVTGNDTKSLNNGSIVGPHN